MHVCRMCISPEGSYACGFCILAECVKGSFPLPGVYNGGADT